METMAHLSNFTRPIILQSFSVIVSLARFLTEMLKKHNRMDWMTLTDRRETN